MVQKIAVLQQLSCFWGWGCYYLFDMYVFRSYLFNYCCKLVDCALIVSFSRLIYFRCNNLLHLSWSVLLYLLYKHLYDGCYSKQLDGIKFNCSRLCCQNDQMPCRIKTLSCCEQNSFLSKFNHYCFHLQELFSVQCKIQSVALI